VSSVLQEYFSWLKDYKMSEKKHQEEEHGESAPLWVISFADLVTLLLSFFVILSAGNAKSVQYDPEFASIVAAIKKAFKYMPPSTANPSSVDLKSIMGMLKPQKGKTGKSGNPGESFQRLDGMSGKHDLVTTVRSGTQTTIGGCVSFDNTSADISPESLSDIRQIADKVRGHMNVFMVKGHTSKDEEYRLKGTNRDLSYERATAVMRKLVEFGVAEEGLRIETCRDFEPLREGAYSEISRSENRRVEVVATEALISEYRGQGPTGNSANKLADLTKKLEEKIKNTTQK